MWKYFVVSLCLLSLTWQVLCEEAAGDSELDVNKLNATADSVLAKPRFLQVALNDKNYAISFLPVNWHTAKEQCTSQNQVLASINSPQDTIDIINYLYKRGASQLGHIGQWSWVSTGLPHYYANWRNGSPEYYCNKNCMELMSDGTWINTDCNQKRPIICQDLPAC